MRVHKIIKYVLEFVVHDRCISFLLNAIENYLTWITCFFHSVILLALHSVSFHQPGSILADDELRTAGVILVDGGLASCSSAALYIPTLSLVALEELVLLLRAALSNVACSTKRSGFAWAIFVLCWRLVCITGLSILRKLVWIRTVESVGERWIK